MNPENKSEFNGMSEERYAYQRAYLSNAFKATYADLCAKGICGLCARQLDIAFLLRKFHQLALYIRWK